MKIKNRLTLIIEVEHDAADVVLGNENIVKSVAAAVFGVHAKPVHATWTIGNPEYLHQEREET